MLRRVVLVLLTMVSLGCGTTGRQRVLRVAVTTSTRDSGLLEELLPTFEMREDVRVDVIAVGTGAALALGSTGDVDAVLVHARTAEDAFMAARHGVRREDVMFNRFLILGPATDPAHVRGASPVNALQQIAKVGAKFVSRGDESGTHQREELLWKSGGGRPAWDGYLASGQGMGATTSIATEMQAYLLIDRGTYLKFKERTDLVPLVEQGEMLRNPYGVIAVNPERSPQVQGELADVFVEFLIAADTQRRIRDYRIAGEALFHPLRLPSPG